MHRQMHGQRYQQTGVGSHCRHHFLNDREIKERRVEEDVEER